MSKDLELVSHIVRGTECVCELLLSESVQVEPPGVRQQERT